MPPTRTSTTSTTGEVTKATRGLGAVSVIDTLEKEKSSEADDGFETVQRSKKSSTAFGGRSIRGSNCPFRLVFELQDLC